jgi:hypothetical protein
LLGLLGLHLTLLTSKRRLARAVRHFCELPNLKGICRGKEQQQQQQQQGGHDAV